MNLFRRAKGSKTRQNEEKDPELYQSSDIPIPDPPKEPQRMSSTSSGSSSQTCLSDVSTPATELAIAPDIIQSPSRVRPQCNPHVEKTVPLIFSPLHAAAEHQHKCQHQPSTSTVNAPYELTKASLFPSMPNPGDFQSRWEFMSTLAGDHRQSIHVLDVSNRRIQPAALKFGVTPLVAQSITDFSFNRNFFGKHDLPAFLDLVKELFPNLERLTLKGDFGVDTNKSSLLKSTSIGSPSPDEDEGRIFSADESESESDQSDNDDVISSSGSGSGSTHSVEKFEAVIAMAERETERMQRLYILYRLPTLSYINDKEVTAEEKNLSHPKSMRGQKIKSHEWVRTAIFPSKERLLAEPLRYYSTEEDINDEHEQGLDDSGLEVELNSGADLVEIHDTTPLHLGLNPIAYQDSTQGLSSQSLPTHRDDPNSDTGLKPTTSLLRMFPHTGTSIARKSEESPPVHPSLVSEANSIPAEIASSPKKQISAGNSPKSTSPKLNLDSFLQKGNAENKVRRKSPKAPSEATDIAVAGTGRLVSKLSSKGDLDKENLSKQIRRRSDRHQDDNKIPPLLGSTVNVKIKKKRSKPKLSSRPPPSPLPASASRMSQPQHSRGRRKHKHSKKKRVLGSISLMDDINDDDDDDDEDEDEDEDNFISKVDEDRLYHESTPSLDSTIDKSCYHLK
jgi:hypothetical protein